MNVELRGVRDGAIVSCGLAAAASLFLRSSDQALGLTTGALLMALNFWLVAIVLRAFIRGSRRQQILSVALATLKFFALLGITYLLVRRFGVHPTAMGVGVALTVITSVLVLAQRLYFQTKGEV